MKLRIPVEQLCLGLPSNILYWIARLKFLFIGEFPSYLNYCRSLRFEDRPDYPHLRKMFKELLVKEGFEYDFCFDWVIMSDKIVNPQALLQLDTGEDGESSNFTKTYNIAI